MNTNTKCKNIKHCELPTVLLQQYLFITVHTIKSGINMASKMIGSPLSSIFQQWTARQKQGDDNTESRSSSYNILLQTSYSLRSRVAAAEPVENPHLFKRAGVSTPSEKASRDIYGGSETGWLLRLLELALQQQQQASNASSSSNHVVFVKTRAQSSLLRELTEEHRQRFTVVDLVAGGPFGWDDDEEKDNDGCNLNNLRTVHRRLLEEVSSKSAPAILVWQSLTPLVSVHGFSRILRLLTALPECLQIWTVHGQALAPGDHGRLEDAANALLCLRGGEMTLVRQGIREPGNILRQALPFRLVPTTTNGRYRVSEENDETDGADIRDEPSTSHNEDKHTPQSKRNSNIHHQEGDTETAIPTKAGRSARGVRLRIEENDGGRNNIREDHEASSGSNLRPRIYLQDDDPEFDDFDEEDPDDDLEL